MQDEAKMDRSKSIELSWRWYGLKKPKYWMRVTTMYFLQSWMRALVLIQTCTYTAHVHICAHTHKHIHAHTQTRTRQFTHPITWTHTLIHMNTQTNTHTPHLIKTQLTNSHTTHKHLKITYAHSFFACQNLIFELT